MRQRRRYTEHMFGILLTLLLAQQPASPPAPVYTGAPMNLDVENAELGNVLRLISAVSHLNFVLDDTVKGTVTAHLVDVPWDLALAAILQSKGLTAVPYGTNLMLVQPLDH